MYIVHTNFMINLTFFTRNVKKYGVCNFTFFLQNVHIFPNDGLLGLKDVHAAFPYVIILSLCLTAIIMQLNE